MSYVTDHPTNFIWRDDIRRRIGQIQAKFPWYTYVNTYYDHPPGYGAWPVGFYDTRSFDVWGGGVVGGRYTGYRGKPLRPRLGKKVFREIFNDPHPPDINWCIYQGRMWWNPATGGLGWTSSPPGPPDSDPGHYNHIHVTMI